MMLNVVVLWWNCWTWYSSRWDCAGVDRSNFISLTKTKVQLKHALRIFSCTLAMLCLTLTILSMCLYRSKAASFLSIYSRTNHMKAAVPHLLTVKCSCHSIHLSASIACSPKTTGRLSTGCTLHTQFQGRVQRISRVCRMSGKLYL